MKKVISLMLAVTMMLGICACGGNNTTKTTEPTSEPGKTTETTGTTATTQPSFLVPDVEGFDADNIVLQFAAVSDIHTSTNANRVQSALQQLKDAALLYTSKGLDAVIVAGDLTNAYTPDQNAKKNEAAQVKSVYEAVFNPSEVPLIFTVGNHDHDSDPGTRNNGGMDLEGFMNAIYSGKTDAYKQYDVACSDSANGSRHAVIGNYHFLFVEPITYNCADGYDGGAKYQEATKTWLDNTLKEITTSAPNQYVFVITHPMIYDTVYGSDLCLGTTIWYTKDLTAILDKYPQVVTFGGHLHFPIADERSIMQTGFTSLGCGSVQYMAIENGGYDNMQSATVMKDNNKVSSGYLVQVDGDGNVRFIRMDFQREVTTKEPFVIETPKADGSHLKKYGKDRGDAANNKAPVLSTNAITIKDNASTEDDVLSVKLNFLAATDDDLIHHYLLEVYEGGKVVETHKILADFYLHGQVSEMKKEYDVTLTYSYARGGKYTVKLKAYDSWNAVSNEVVYAYEPVLDTSKVTFPDVYADIDFAGGTATDTKGNINIELIGGASVANGTFKFGDATKTVGALNIAGGSQYAKLTFAKVDDMETFLSNDFTVELLYVSRSKTGKQGIFSGIEEKGFGISEVDGKPTFEACVVKTIRTATAENVSSSEELVHVVATYAPSSALFAIYVNGEMVSTKASGNPKDQGKIFALGANIKKDGTAENFANDLSIVDVKVYNAKFSQAQALVRYQNVLAEYKN